MKNNNVRQPLDFLFTKKKKKIKAFFADGYVKNCMLLACVFFMTSLSFLFVSFRLC